MMYRTAAAVRQGCICSVVLGTRNVVPVICGAGEITPGMYVKILPLWTSM